MHTPLPITTERILESLEAAIEYFDQRADADENRPNPEMRLQMELEDVRMALQRAWGLPVDDRGYFHAAQDTLWAARQTITNLRQQLSVQQRYIEELENQLEPSVIAEIRAELEAQEESQ